MEVNQTVEEAEEVETRVVVTAIRSLVVAAAVVVAVAAEAAVVVEATTLTPLSSISEEGRMQKRVSWNEGHTSAAGKSPVPM